jgi:hypothetical protein
MHNADDEAIALLCGSCAMVLSAPPRPVSSICAGVSAAGVVEVIVDGCVVVVELACAVVGLQGICAEPVLAGFRILHTA